MNWEYKIRLIQFINYIISLFAIYYLVSTNELYWLWYTFVFYILFGVISYGLTFHRLLAHRSFQVHRITEIVLSYISVFSTVGPTVAWVAIHRHHHKHSDNSRDVHSPVNSSGTLIFLGKMNTLQTIGPPRDLLKDPLHQTIKNHYFKILFTGIAILFLINPLLVVFAYSFPTMLAFHGATSVNSLGHLKGYRNHNTNDNSHNNLFVNLITLGEGLHNNHHAEPTKWNTGEKWWEIDPIAWVIKLIKR